MGLDTGHNINKQTIKQSNCTFGFKPGTNVKQKKSTRVATGGEVRRVELWLRIDGRRVDMN